MASIHSRTGTAQAMTEMKTTAATRNTVVKPNI
jgi:hypothetical protein